MGKNLDVADGQIMDCRDLMVAKDFDIGDRGRIFLTGCSDVGANFGSWYGVVECEIIGKIDAHRYFTDNRYLIRCAKVLRDDVVGGCGQIEATVSEYSLFLMTEEQYDMYDKCPEVASSLVCATYHILGGYKSPLCMLNWQMETVNTMKKRGEDPNDIAYQLKQYFDPKYTRVVPMLDDFMPKYESELRKAREQFKSSYWEI